MSQSLQENNPISPWEKSLVRSKISNDFFHAFSFVPGKTNIGN